VLLRNRPIPSTVTARPMMAAVEAEGMSPSENFNFDQ